MEPVIIIPCLDMMNGRVVKGVHFVELITPTALLKPPVPIVRGADELAFLDVTERDGGERRLIS